MTHTPKNRNAELCEEFGIISLMSNFLKLFVKVLRNRIYMKCEKCPIETQFGFKNYRVPETSFYLQVLVERRRDVCIVYIDYRKAFDRMKH